MPRARRRPTRKKRGEGLGFNGGGPKYRQKLEKGLRMQRVQQEDVSKKDKALWTKEDRQGLKINEERCMRRRCDEGQKKGGHGLLTA
ncbi:hypothetical protein BY996DRAFT_6541417 [Phakopsora pachyrhizi]|uniref:rRNA-processing protein FYV7 n=1 Tax=Phakopsora pachyrhizi TaxID=170000 RepID=A0AAV0ARU5_PHAPC|nr:hypothetical protein BY996DRAFT_6541417 [Phakopsora pachyrhizi]CAH7671164.1 hypothetical protein PPACK8108_LOCUS5923 [Phakopsora pachyrhizi]